MVMGLLACLLLLLSQLVINSFHSWARALFGSKLLFYFLRLHKKTEQVSKQTSKQAQTNKQAFETILFFAYDLTFTLKHSFFLFTTAIGTAIAAITATILYNSRGNREDTHTQYIQRLYNRELNCWHMNMSVCSPSHNYDGGCDFSFSSLW